MPTGKSVRWRGAAGRGLGAGLGAPGPVGERWASLTIAASQRPRLTTRPALSSSYHTASREKLRDRFGALVDLVHRPAAPRRVVLGVIDAERLAHRRHEVRRT